MHGAVRREYEKSAIDNRSGTEIDESVSSFSSIGSNMSRSSTFNMLDFDSDIDDSDDDEDDCDINEYDRNIRSNNLKKKSKDNDDDDDNEDDHDDSNKIVYSTKPKIPRGGSNSRRSKQ